MDKIVYSQKAPVKNNTVVRTFLFALLFALLCVLLFVANYLPFSGIISLCVIFLFALSVYKLMNKTVFDITYVLYEDKLIFKRKYGKIEMEAETFPLDQAEFTEKEIKYNNKSYPFYPDEKMAELLLK